MRMKLAAALGLVAILASGAYAADPPSMDEIVKDFQQKGKSFSTVTRVWSQIVSFDIPPGFHGVYEKTTGPNFMLELVPQNETATAWTQMITLTGHRGLAANPNVTPQLLASNIGAGFQKACPETFNAAGLGPMHTTEGTPAQGFSVLSSCGWVKAPGSDRSESALILALAGVHDYYTVQWAERGPSSPQKLELGDPKWRARLMQLNAKLICPIAVANDPAGPGC